MVIPSILSLSAVCSASLLVSSQETSHCGSAQGSPLQKSYHCSGPHSPLALTVPVHLALLYTWPRGCVGPPYIGTVCGTSLVQLRILWRFMPQPYFLCSQSSILSVFINHLAQSWGVRGMPHARDGVRIKMRPDPTSLEI